jgi:hypothetical protein
LNLAEAARWSRREYLATTPIARMLRKISRTRRNTFRG